jgi:hypothetical protein
MADDQKKIVPIDYTHREYESIRKDLIDIAQRFYPDTFQDFSEASFGSLMLDAVAYLGDQLSFYLDYNVNETFLDTAYEYNNVLRHGRVLGYKYTGRPSTYGQVALFVLVPASSTGIGPDTDYIPLLKRGSRFTSTAGQGYVLTENVDFANSKNPVVAAQIDASTGAPSSYAIKAYGNVVSGYFGQEEIKVGSYERFRRLKLSAQNVSEIISIFDSSGNEYFEVGYLAQDMVFKEMSNKNYKNDNVPSILKPYLVSRKFVVERDRFNTYLQFGSGDTAAGQIIADPQAVAMEIFGKSYVTDTTFDPTRLSKTESFGISPYNTTLTVVYRAVNPNDSNLGAGALTSVATADMEFPDRTALVSATANTVIASLEVNNEMPIVGNVTTPTSDEVKRRVYDTFPTQNRAVTQADYENVAYRMPAKFGSIKRCSVQRDPDSMKRNLNMYVISEDQFGKLTTTNSTIKNNLRTWLNHYRMINDTVDILNPFVINIAIEFSARPTPDADRYVVLEQAINALKELYNTPFYIGEQLSVTDIYAKLREVNGVLDVTKVKLINKTAGNYAGTTFDINANMSPDGTYLIAPKNCVFELKFPAVDIKGMIK